MKILENCNSKYFYSIISWRRIKNVIKGLIIKRDWNEGSLIVKEDLKDFNKNLF